MMNTNANFQSAKVERLITPKNGGEPYTWVKLRGWSGNPEYARFFPERETEQGIMSAMFAFQVAVENPQTLQTEWVDILVYDDDRTGMAMATEMASHMTNDQNPQVGFFLIEGYGKTEAFKTRQGVDMVKTKVVAKVIQCQALQPYRNEMQTQQNGSIFGAVQNPAPQPHMAQERSATPQPAPRQTQAPKTPQRPSGRLLEHARNMEPNINDDQDLGPTFPSEEGWSDAPF